MRRATFQFLRGFGSILVLVPPTRPLAAAPILLDVESTEDAVRSYWESVGGYFQLAMAQEVEPARESR
jgi:hypothetical protein